MNRRTLWMLGGLGLAGFLVAGAGFAELLTYPPARAWLQAFREHAPGPLFILLTVFLPALGFPISPFLVLAGLKFGAPLGLLLMAASIPAHLLLTRLLGERALKPILRVFHRGGDHFDPPAIFGDRAWWTMVFTLVPGPPYCVKNYLLVFANTPTRLLLGVIWPAHALAASPYVVLGASVAEGRLRLFLLGLSLLLTVIGLARWVDRRRRRAARPSPR